MNCKARIKSPFLFITNILFIYFKKISVLTPLWKSIFNKQEKLSPKTNTTLSDTRSRLSQALIEINDLVWEKMDDYAPDYPKLNQAEKDFLHISYLQGQVDNGGFDQFFFNGSGDYCYEILESLQRIQAYRTFSIVSSAFQLFPIQPIPNDTRIRRTAMESLDENISYGWDKLDNQFYYYGEDLETMLLKYIIENPEHIGSEIAQKNKDLVESVIQRMNAIHSANIFMTEQQVEKGIKAIGRGETLLSFRRKLIDSGIDNSAATYITRESFRRVLTKSGKAKIIRGGVWFICGITVTLFIFLIATKIYYLLSFATLWGIIQIFRGYSLLKSAKNLESSLPSNHSL